ncbi:unnamed protein product [Fusarium langsethiae]|nr:unnamed protein product [Fusarium langsethiae]
MRPFGTLKKGNYFKPGSEPLLTEIRDFEPQFASLPPEVPRRVPKYVDISGLTSEDLLSEVEIIPVHAGCSADQFSSAVDRGVKGIILEGYNDGWWPDASKGQIAERAKSDELVVVMTSRHCSARVTEARVDGVLPGGEWISDQLLNILQIFIKLEYNKKNIKEFILNPFEWITVA